MTAPAATVPFPGGAPAPVRHISVRVDAPFAGVNAFLGDPANMALWAEGLGKGFRRIEPLLWEAETAFGPMRIAFTPPNPYGVADHSLLPEGAAPMFNALRAIPNGAGCEITFVLMRREGMTEAEFAADEAAVTRDLAALRRLLEAGGDAGTARGA